MLINESLKNVVVKQDLNKTSKGPVSLTRVLIRIHVYSLKVLFVNPREKLKTTCLKDDQIVCQPIRSKGGHIGFWIHLKIIKLGLDLSRNICNKFGVDPCSRS